MLLHVKISWTPSLPGSMLLRRELSRPLTLAPSQSTLSSDGNEYLRQASSPGHKESPISVSTMHEPKPGKGIGRRPRKGGGKGRGKEEKKTKLPSIKNQIRAVQRLLAKVGGDPKVRQKQQERLAELLLAKAQHDKAERERKFARRYHKVRFFERVKIERQLHKLEKQAAAGPLFPEGQAQLEQLKEDLQYVLHFPKGVKYVSLLKNAEDPQDQARLESERARLRVLVRQQLAEAALVAEADEGRSLARKVQAALLGAAGVGGAAGESDQESGGLGEEDDFFLHSSSDEEEAAVGGGAGSGQQHGGRSSGTAAAGRGAKGDLGSGSKEEKRVDSVSVSEEDLAEASGSEGLEGDCSEGEESEGEEEEASGSGGDCGPAGGRPWQGGKPAGDGAMRKQQDQRAGTLIPRGAGQRQQQVVRQQQGQGVRGAGGTVGSPQKRPWQGPGPRQQQHKGAGPRQQAKPAEQRSNGFSRLQQSRPANLGHRAGSGVAPGGAVGKEGGGAAGKAGGGPQGPAKPQHSQGAGKRPAAAAEKQPLRKRSEGGRKRRKKGPKD